MNNIMLRVYSPRAFQHEIVSHVGRIDPNIAATQYIRKSADILQITEFLLVGVQALFQVISVFIQLHQQNPGARTKIEIELPDGRSLEVDTTQPDIDIEKIVSDFLASGQEPTKPDNAP